MMCFKGISICFFRGFVAKLEALYIPLTPFKGGICQSSRTRFFLKLRDVSHSDFKSTYDEMGIALFPIPLLRGNRGVLRALYLPKNSRKKPILKLIRIILKSILLSIVLLFLACGKSDKVVEIPLTQISTWHGVDADGNAAVGFPSDFIVSSQGEIVVTDVRLNQILFFEQYGRLIRRVGRPGQGPLEFAIPDDIAQAGDRLVVWDYQNNRLQFLALDGEFLSSSVPAPRIDFNSKTFDQAGNLYYATGGFRADSLVYVYNDAGDFIKTFGRLAGEKVDRADLEALKQTTKQRLLHPLMKNAVLLCATSDENIFVVHTALPVLKKYSKQGQKLFEIQIDDPVFNSMQDEFYAVNDSLPEFSFKPLRFWSEATADPTGGVFLLLNDIEKMIVYRFDASGKLIEKYFGPKENIYKIYFDGVDLWAIGRLNLAFYRFSLTPVAGAATDE
jgi:hypothetical protein